jgi:hypothetical protein
VFFDYVQQGTETTWEYRIHCPVFTLRVGIGCSIVFGVCKPIRTYIGPPRVGVFVCRYTGPVGRRGIDLSIKSDHGEAFGGTIDYIGVEACSDWNCYPAFVTSQ